MYEFAPLIQIRAGLSGEVESGTVFALNSNIPNIFKIYSNFLGSSNCILSTTVSS